MDRAAAGRRLATALGGCTGTAPVIVGLARGGIVVASEIANALGAPLDFVVARKLRVPGQPEIAAGAVAPGSIVVNDEVVRELAISQRYLDIAAEELGKEVDERTRRYRRTRPTVDLTSRHAVLVDDGIASGATLRAAIRSIRGAGAIHVTAAAPVASALGLTAAREADEVVVLVVPNAFRAVSEAYHDFTQVSDLTIELLLSDVSASRRGVRCG